MTGLELAQQLLEAQSRALKAAAAQLDDDFNKALKLLAACKGSVWVLVFGKSAAVGEKIAATLRSSGLKAIVVHPLDALGGEMAAVEKGDLALAVSSTGESGDLVRIIPHLKRTKIKLIALTPSPRSSLGRAADVLIKTQLPRDPADSRAGWSACLSALALGDLLGVCLLHNRMPEEITGAEQDGAGEAVTTVRDLLAMRPLNPTAPGDMIFRDALLEMSQKGLGAISIVDAAGKLTGIMTDGDIRRLIQRSVGSLSRLFLTNVDTVMTRNPRNIPPEKSVFEALGIMEDNAITVLPVVGKNGEPAGMVHLHDLVQLGLMHNKPTSKKKPAAKKKKPAAKKKKRGGAGRAKNK